MQIPLTNSLAPLIDRIASINNQTLVIFDINQVLIKQESSIFNKPGRVWREQLLKTIWNDFTPDQINRLWSLILLGEPNRLADTRLPSIIRSLKEHHAPVIAQTSCPIGSFGHIKSLEDWNIKRLAENNISFDGSFAEYDPLEIKLTTEKINDNAKFKSGVLFNASAFRFTKGDVLDAFLRKINWVPSQIIFVDNQLDNIESIGTFAHKQNIQFLGIYLTSVQETLKPFDEKLAAFQFQYLRDNDVWLPDDKAQAFMKE